MSPGEYEEWLWSIEFDPPATHLLRATNALLADLIAVTMNAHFRDENGDPLGRTGADFLRDPDDVGDEDEDTVENGDDLTASEGLTQLHPMSQPGIRAGVAGVRPTGAKVPASIMGLFGGGETEE